ncbi:MAG: hypothetical protein NVSMB56_14530 [Pyrinomonadaceae bacterium]
MQPDNLTYAHLSWHNLPSSLQGALALKIQCLYGNAASQQAFEALSPDKQQALLLLWWRLSQLNLWRAVRRIDNVWGEGGVGMTFAAYPFLASGLINARCEGRRRFTSFLARHKNSTAGFYERGRHAAILHFLYAEDANNQDDAASRRWSVHFDYNSPVGSLHSAWRHLRAEYFGGFAPNWRNIRTTLRFELPS